MSDMQSFLIVFDRQSGESTVTPFSSGSDAMQARRSTELETDDPNVEIVVVGARSLTELKQTHSRYFSQDERSERRNSGSWQESLENLRSLQALNAAG